MAIRRFKVGDRITGLIPGPSLVPGVVTEVTDSRVTFRYLGGTYTSLNHPDFLGDDSRAPWHTDDEFWNGRVRAWESIESSLAAERRQQCRYCGRSFDPATPKACTEAPVSVYFHGT